MRRIDLPASLGDAFTVSEAMDAGVARSRLRASDLVRVHRGLRVRAGVTAEFGPTDHHYERLRKSLIHRARLYSRVMAGNQFFTHVVAAAIWQLPVPLGLLDEERALDVGVLVPGRHPRRAGIAGHQMQPHLVTLAEVDGLRVTDPVSTWATMASVLVSDIELVALGDAVVRERIFTTDRRQLATVDDLARAVTCRRAGVGRLRHAVRRVRTRSASSGETRCRLVMIDGGLPEPRLNVVVRDPAGALVAVVDLAYPAAKIAVEYEGDQHRTDPAQWAKDIARHESLTAMGWIVIRVTKAQLYDAPRSVVERVRRAVATRGTGRT